MQLTHPQRTAGEAKGGAVFIALLWHIVTIGAGRIAGEHGGKRCDVLACLDLQAHARRRERIGRSAADHIGSEDAGPPEGAADQAAGRVTGEEFAVGDDLAEPYRETVGEALFEPGGVQARGRQRVDIAGVGNASGIVHDIMAAVVNLEHGQVSLGAAPADQCFQIGVDREMQLTLVARLAPDAAGQDTKDLVGVFDLELDAAFCFQRGARAAPIAGQRFLLPDGFRLALGECWHDSKR